jgi:hypothetical protein
MGPVNGVTNDFWADFEARDTVVIQSSDQGTVRFAELLLNASLEDIERHASLHGGAQDGTESAVGSGGGNRGETSHSGAVE